MTTVSHDRTRSTTRASLVGVAVGLAVLSLYVVGGLVVAGWSLADFLAHLSVGVALSLLLAAGVATAVFAVPVAAYLRYGLVSPLVVLLVVVVGWTAYGLATDVLTAQTVFGLAVYAFYLAPLYALLYGAAGGIEYWTRRSDGASRRAG